MSSGKKAAHISLLAAGIGLVTAVCGLLAQLPWPDPPDPPDPTEQHDPFGCSPAGRAHLRLSESRGPSGTELTVTGTDFCPEVQVEVFFGVDTLQFAETGTDGAFSVSVRIPGSLDAVGPLQVDIRARGEGGRFATRPFQLTLE